MPHNRPQEIPMDFVIIEEQDAIPWKKGRHHEGKEHQHHGKKHDRKFHKREESDSDDEGHKRHHGDHHGWKKFPLFHREMIFEAEPKFVREVKQFVHKAFGMIFRELHVMDYLVDAKIEAIHFVTDFLTKDGLDLVQGINAELITFQDKVSRFNDRINDGRAEICVNGQPASFFVEPIHYMICSQTMDIVLDAMKQFVLRPVVHFTGQRVLDIDRFILRHRGEGGRVEFLQ
jgi:hypothetical protein